ncbi:MAG TPA: type II toxin-antitoxin system VapC family toxin [Thermoanaerobaculia bacterium]|jgi:hypothetical protein|nr:type II toxin-antitoxin system VapC family toxin [Thermoanaerobaculia bacterium]
MAKPKLYVETSIVSYLTAQPSRDIITAARQQLTRDWWQTTRGDFDLYISAFVIREASSGNREAAALRIEALRDLPEIALTEEVDLFSEELMKKVPLPEKAAVDALHIAASVIGGMEYLLTWNFKHLANAVIRRKIDQVCRLRGFEPCIICTPEELLEKE